jgi:nitrite reductase (NADH) large subunit
VATKLKVAGVQVFSAGEFRADSTHRELRLSDPENNLQRTLLVRDGCIVGIALVGDVRDGQYYFDLMQRCVDVRPLLEALLFGQSTVAASALPVHAAGASQAA